MITFVTDVRQGEVAFPYCVFTRPILIYDLDGSKLLKRPAPEIGWTHESLCKLSESLSDITRDGADAYLGSTWVGSTEV